MDNKLKVFSDFDGTITKVDIGNLIFKTFAGDHILPLIQLWKDKQITSKDLLTRECDLARIKSIDDLNELIDKQSIDESFLDFVKLCDENNFEIIILSDGMHFYIEKILDKNGLGHLKYYSNTFKYIQNDSEYINIFAEFPFTDSECDLCGNCKRNHLLYHSEDEEVIVYIGDGYSDRCPVEFSDIVFAKGQLLSHCKKNKIPCIEFNDFSDIIENFSEILSKKRVHKKRRAELKRKEILLQG